MSRKFLAVAGAIGLMAAAGAVGATGALGGPSSSYRHVAKPKAHGAFTPSSYRVDIQAVYDATGNPSLVANFSPDGGLTKARWSICAPPDVHICMPASVTQFLKAGAAPVGTVFQATVNYRGRTYVAGTAPWLGTVRATIAPQLGGRLRYGTPVTPHEASWTGGWQTDSTVNRRDGGGSGGHGPNLDFLSVEACRTRDARHCVNLSAPGNEGSADARR